MAAGDGFGYAIAMLETREDSEDGSVVTLVVGAYRGKATPTADHGGAAYVLKSTLHEPHS